MSTSNLEPWWDDVQPADTQVIKAKLREVAVGLQYIEDLMRQDRLPIDLQVNPDFQGVLRLVNRLEDLSDHRRRRRNRAKFN